MPVETPSHAVEGVRHIAQMSAELEAMATVAHLDGLVYFLAFAEAEAEIALGRGQVGRGARGGAA